MDSSSSTGSGSRMTARQSDERRIDININQHESSHPVSSSSSSFIQSRNDNNTSNTITITNSDHMEGMSLPLPLLPQHKLVQQQRQLTSSFIQRKCLLVFVVLILSSASISIRMWSSKNNPHEISITDDPAHDSRSSSSSSSSSWSRSFVADFDDDRLGFGPRRIRREAEKVLGEGEEETTTSSETHHGNHTRHEKSNETTPGMDCEPAAFLEFPPDLFNQFLRSHGFVVIHILVSCYMFYCLAVVCDNYFLPSLEECSSRLGLSDDVAGATFMAAGSSAPELFTALLGK
jgi:hypothetical protein